MQTYDLSKRRPNPESGYLNAGTRAETPAANPDTGYSLTGETVRSLLATLVLGVVVSGVYPLVVWGLGQGLFHHQANGSLIVAADGKTVLGSELLGQNFGGKQ